MRKSLIIKQNETKTTARTTKPNGGVDESKRTKYINNN